MDRSVNSSPDEMEMDGEMNEGGVVKSSMCDNDKEAARDAVTESIARWLFETGINPRLATLPSFHKMLEAIGKYGPGLGPPTAEEYESCVEKEILKAKQRVESFKERLKIKGCSLIVFTWSDWKGRETVNFVAHSAYSESGMVFLGSFDMSVKGPDVDFVDNLMKDLGEENVVQIITDGPQCELMMTNLLASKLPSVFMTTCAAHTVYLMLDDICKLAPFKCVIAMAREATAFIHGYPKALSLMREFTGEIELVKPGINRFATTFLTLQTMQTKKYELKRMFCLTKWGKSDISIKKTRRKVYNTIVSFKFWDDVDYALRVFEPLVKVLRRVDNDSKPSMGFVYGELRVAKAEIATSLNQKEKKYLPIWAIIDNRSKEKLETSLHKTAHYLNPYYYYANKEDIEKDSSFKEEFINCIEKLYGNKFDIMDKVISQLQMYVYAMGSFGKGFAQNRCTHPNLSPAIWWDFHGYSAPELRDMAIRILSLIPSFSGCYRNWNTVEMFHTKERKTLGHQESRDQTFVKLNSRLKSLSEIKERDPLAAYHLDEGEVTEWIEGPDSPHDSDGGEVLSKGPLTKKARIEAASSSKRPRDDEEDKDTEPKRLKDDKEDKDTESNPKDDEEDKDASSEEELDEDYESEEELDLDDEY